MDDPEIELVLNLTTPISHYEEALFVNTDPSRAGIASIKKGLDIYVS
jgi:hypothetical protein